MKKEIVNNMSWEELVAACKRLGNDDDLNTIVAKSLMIEAYIARTVNTAKKSAHNAFALNESNVMSASLWLGELSSKAYNIVAEQKGIDPIEKV